MRGVTRSDEGFAGGMLVGGRGDVAMLGMRSERKRSRSTSGLLKEADGSNTVLGTRDAFSTGAGVLIGLSLFARNHSDFLAGSTVLLLLLRALSTPEVLDMETQFSNYRLYVPRSFIRFVHLACVWPLLWTGMWMIASSSRWAFMLTMFYVVFYVLAERSIVGLTSAALVAGVYASSLVVIKQIDNPFETGAWIHVALWALQFVVEVSVEGWVNTFHVLNLMRRHLLQIILMTPLFTTIEIFLALGFRKDFARKVRANVTGMRRELKSEMHED
mmetsp:Transcript_5877/g.12030  ORF Transcript_5877/g.12030 Transcript_5877/m.12030 type:complete len:273 (+) Transcript_5877:491-1309(+)|eukprot:CAMPEP_0171499158 /NCGR_PEP_ID=MMETSP0958-20121227/8278_1 /TAXON_ID=87120 /ORGANISM="Aurantiochytrium limacinum, Strain ATCCMYA-1381" /LENGTH=272 /DNA_ID=CAMNT_0012033693 /DNA_START=830 /DNA_END=1648 /DNA_ORIENTATION=-